MIALALFDRCAQQDSVGCRAAGSQLYVLTQLELIFSATHCVWPNSAHVHMLLSIADGRVTLRSASNELEFMGMTS